MKNEPLPKTMKQLAKMLKVSVSTISRGLIDHPSIGLVTRIRIQKMATSLGYEPNKQAVFLRKGTTMTIGVIVPELCDPFYSSAVNNIEHVADQNGYSVLLAQSRGNAEIESEHISKMRRFRVDGLIIALGEKTFNHEHILPIINSGIPVVFLNFVPQISNIHYVTSNPGEAIGKAVTYLHERGHRTIGFLNGPKKFHESQKRLQGYTRALNNLSLKHEPKFVSNCIPSYAKIENAVQRLFMHDVKPTALITYNDRATIEVIRALKKEQQAGIELVGYSLNPIIKQFCYSPFTTIEQFPELQGQKAAEILFFLINKKDNRAATVDYNTIEIDPNLNREIYL